MLTLFDRQLLSDKNWTLPANLEVINPVCKGKYPGKGVGLYSQGLKSGDIIVGVEALILAIDSFEELKAVSGLCTKGTLHSVLY